MAESPAELARRWFEEVWNGRKAATARTLLHPEGVGHLEGMDVRGPEEFLSARDALLGAFPDLRVRVEATVAQGEDVVVRWSAAGTHQGDGLGFPATSRAASFRGMTWMRFSDGRIVEGWDSWNVGRLLQELQAPAGSAAPKAGAASAGG
jgi:steroid delta-isomerase-like uncharacterized protein